MESGETITKDKLREKPVLSLEEIQQRCQTCFITNPLACKEVCDIWKLKQEYLALRKDLPERPDTATVMATATDQTNMEILRILSQGPTSAENLSTQRGSPTIEVDRALRSLVKTGLVRAEDATYEITIAGRRTLDALEKYSSLELEKIDSVNKRVIQLLAHGVTTLDELNEEVPKNELTRALRYLKMHGVVEKTSGRQVLYFATKRRPTRRLAPNELAVFKSLPKEGISPQELSKKLDLTLPSIYRYLRLLRYKRHAIRRKQSPTFELTAVGSQIAEALEKVEKVVQSFSSKDFA